MPPNDLFLHLNGMRYHISDWGGPAAAQPVLLVHGLASNAKIWNFVAPLLAASHRVAAVDQRSHGQTSPPKDNDFSFSAVCGDLREVGVQLGFERPLLVGHSWGASVALEYAARHPEQIAGAVLVDGGFVGIGGQLTWEETEQRLAPPRLAGTPLATFRDRVIHFMGEMYSEERLEVVLGNFEILPDNTIAPHLAFDNHMKIVRAMWEQQPQWLYPQVRCPALFLPCVPPEPHEPEAQDFLAWKRQSVEMVQRWMLRARVDWLSDSIHDVPLQRPELLAEKISLFASGL